MSPSGLLRALAERSRTPEQAARRVVCAPDDIPEEFHIRERREWEDYMVVLYSARCSPAHPVAAQPPVFPGYTVVSKGLFSWSASPGSSGRDLVEKDLVREMPGELVTYTAGGGLNAAFGHVRGHVHAPEKVSAVEVLFDSGEIVRGDVTDGVYVVFATGTTGACELRALGADDRVLQRTDLVAEQVSQASPKQCAELRR